jgi:two-component system chemotaxis response regulator CheV
MTANANMTENRMAGDNRLELLMFYLENGQRFGINVYKVKEILKCPKLNQIPNSHPVVKGIATIREHKITAIDLSAAIGHSVMEESEGQTLIVSECNRSLVGFLVAGVDRIVTLKWEDMTAPPNGVQSGTYMTAVTNIDGKLIELIDVEKVLDEVIGEHSIISQEFIGKHDNSGRHVMLVDDSMVARNQVERVLSALGIEAIICKNGEEAYQLLETWVSEGKNVYDMIDLIICDIEMPKMDGYTLTRNIKAHPEMEDLFIILHTSISGSFNEHMVEAAGADKFLPKYHPDELAEMILSVFDD